jgi:uncharacterized protein (DUF427 family)
MTAMRPKPIKPERGQESVWDYPRPPRLERTTKRLEIVMNGVKIADTNRAYRVLETSHPPVYYIPLEDVRREYLEASSNSSFCEWKGGARYYTVRVGDRVARDAAWFYPFRADHEFCGVLRGSRAGSGGRRVLRGRRARHAATWRVLRRLDYPRHRWAVQR